MAYTARTYGQSVYDRGPRELGGRPEWSVIVDPRFSLFLNVVTPDRTIYEANPLRAGSDRRLPAGSIDFEQTSESLEYKKSS